MATNIYKVKLVNPADKTRRHRVEFDVTPDITETRNVNYKVLDPVHMPGQILVYGNTSSRVFSVSNVRFISRTEEEAYKNLQNLQFLRSWTMSKFGKDEFNLSETQQQAHNDFNDNQANVLDSNEPPAATPLDNLGLLGEPPAVLLFSAYSDVTKDILQHFNRIPVVISNLTITYPSDIDFINARAPGKTDDVPMPTIITVEISLTEAHSPNEMEQFSLDAFRRGFLPHF